MSDKTNPENPSEKEKILEKTPAKGFEQPSNPAANKSADLGANLGAMGSSPVGANQGGTNLGGANPEGKEELKDILSSIRTMIDQDKTFFQTKFKGNSPKSDTIELTSMINKEGKVVELPLLSQPNSVGQKGSHQPPVGTPLTTLTASNAPNATAQGILPPKDILPEDPPLSPQQQEIFRVLAKAIIKEWTATELPLLTKQIITAELARKNLLNPKDTKAGTQSNKEPSQ